MPTTLILDDFTGTSLDPAWTRHGVTSSQETWNNPGLTVSSLLNQGYLRPAPSGDFSVEIKVTISDTSHMFGPWILDANGNGIGGTWYTNPAAALVTSISAYGYSGTFAQVGSAQSTGRIRITKTGTSYTVAYSTNDGATWTAESPAITWAGTPTAVGFGAYYLTQATISATEFKVSSPGGSAPTGSLAATTPRATASLAGAYTAPAAPNGNLAAVTPRATVSLAGSYLSTATGSLAATAPRVAAALSGSYSGTTGTDTANLLNGRDRQASGYVTVTVPVVAVPGHLVVGERKDKARPLPTPTMVNGRPT